MESNTIVKVKNYGQEHVLSMGDLCKIPIDNIYFSKCDQELDLISLL